MGKKLEGKTALVTGGSGGIGYTTAEELIKEGAFVFITGRRQAELDAAVKKLGANAAGVQGDVANLADLDRLYGVIKDKKGKLDVLFVNAGIYEFAPVTEITEEHFDKTFNINVKGLLFTVQKALPLLNDGASIILNASVVSSLGLEAASVYSASKAAVRSFARTWATDLKARNIRVNAISPGPVVTDNWHNLMTPEEIKAFTEKMTAGIPLGRTGETAEIAKGVVFLATSDSSYVNGFDLIVDGGMTQV